MLRLVLDCIPTSSPRGCRPAFRRRRDRKSTRLNSSHANISYAVFCLKKKKKEARSSHTDDYANVLRIKPANVHQRERAVTIYTNYDDTRVGHIESTVTDVDGITHEIA